MKYVVGKLVLMFDVGEFGIEFSELMAVNVSWAPQSKLLLVISLSIRWL